MAKTKHPKVGEHVRLTTPKTFLRCGYPLTTAQVGIDHKDEVNVLTNKALAAIGAAQDDHRLAARIASTVAFMILQRLSYGGRERKVYEEELEPYVVKEYMSYDWVVESRQIVKTGTYSPGWSGYSYEGEYDYEPATLDGGATHCVLTLTTTSTNGYMRSIRTLSSNVERAS